MVDLNDLIEVHGCIDIRIDDKRAAYSLNIAPQDIVFFLTSVEHFFELLVGDLSDLVGDILNVG